MGDLISRSEAIYNVKDYMKMTKSPTAKRACYDIIAILQNEKLTPTEFDVENTLKELEVQKQQYHKQAEKTKRCLEISIKNRSKAWCCENAIAIVKSNRINNQKSST